MLIPLNCELANKVPYSSTKRGSSSYREAKGSATSKMYKEEGRVSSSKQRIDSISPIQSKPPSRSQRVQFPSLHHRTLLTPPSLLTSRHLPQSSTTFYPDHKSRATPPTPPTCLEHNLPWVRKINPFSLTRGPGFSSGSSPDSRGGTKPAPHLIPKGTLR